MTSTNSAEKKAEEIKLIRAAKIERSARWVLDFRTTLKELEPALSEIELAILTHAAVTDCANEAVTDELKRLHP